MNRTSFQKHWTRPLLVGSTLALGAAVTWFWVIGIIGSVIDQWTFSQINEQIAVLRDGNVLISHYGPGGTTYRTLGGEPVVDQARMQEASTGSSSPEGSRTTTSDSYGWAARIIGYRDTRLPPTYWYLIADDTPGGRAYFAGFDSRSKEAIGYLGLGGFRADVPPPSEQFDGLAATAGVTGRPGQEPDATASGVPYVFLVSEATLYRFDLSQRSVRQISLASTEIKSVSDLLELPKTDTLIGEKQQLSVRAADSLFVVNFDGELLQTIPIPTAIKDQFFDIVYWSDGSSVLVARERRGAGEVYWLDGQGRTTRHETVQLVSTDIRDLIRRWIWQTAVASPFPVLLAFYLLVVFPNTLMIFRMAPTFGAAVLSVLSESWPLLLFACLLAVALVPLVLRRQKLFAAPGTVGWVLLVLLMGPAGLLGYWLHRHWPVLRRCDSCGRTIPTDSLECAVCNVELPPPVAKGIEVLA